MSKVSKSDLQKVMHRLPQPSINGMNHVTLAVSDVEKSFKFYTQILGLRPICKWNKGAYFTTGDPKNPASLWFVLNYDENRKVTTSACYTHYAFSVAQNDFEALQKRIIETGAEIFKDNTSPGNSLYFYDPDGHKLEIHTGNLKQRIKVKQENPDNWQNVVWYEAKL